MKDKSEMNKEIYDLFDIIRYRSPEKDIEKLYVRTMFYIGNYDIESIGFPIRGKDVFVNKDTTIDDFKEMLKWITHCITIRNLNL